MTTRRKSGRAKTPARPKQAPPQAPPLVNPDPGLIDRLEEAGAALIDPDFATDVTPEMAADMLAGNARNRNIKPQKIEEYAGALERGEWRYNGDSVRITTAGQLLDGQHRLMAIHQTGIPARLLVAVIEEENALQAQATMDAGSKRKFSDMLQIEGVQNATTVAGAATLIWAYEQDGVPSAQNRVVSATNQQKYDVLARHPGIHESASRGKQAPWVTGALGAALHYLFSTADRDDADEFFRLLKRGEGLEKGNPILALRERLMREEHKAAGQLHSRVRAAFVVIAWNAWRQGRTLQKLQFRPGGASPDRFPAVDGIDESMFRFAGEEEVTS